MGKGEGEGEERDGGRERGIPPASPPTPPAHRLGPRGSRGREGEESWIHILINREKGEGERRQRRGWGGVCVCGGDVTRRISRPCRGGRRRRPPACRPRRASTCPESALSPSPSLSPSLYRPRPTQERIRIRTDIQPPPPTPPSPLVSPPYPHPPSAFSEGRGGGTRRRRRCSCVCVCVCVCLSCVCVWGGRHPSSEEMQRVYVPGTEARSAP